MLFADAIWCSELCPTAHGAVVWREAQSLMGCRDEGKILPSQEKDKGGGEDAGDSSKSIGRCLTPA